MKFSGHASNICGWTLWAILALLLIVGAAYAQERKTSPHPRTAPQDQDVKIPVEEPTAKPAAPAIHSKVNAMEQHHSESSTNAVNDATMVSYTARIIPTMLSLLSLLFTIILAAVVMLGIRSRHKLNKELEKLKISIDDSSKKINARIDKCARVEDVEGLPKLRSELDGLRREINKQKLAPVQVLAHPVASANSIAGDSSIQSQAAEMAPAGSTGTASGLTTPTAMRREWEKQGILIGKAGWSRFSGQFEQEAAPPTLWLAQSSPSDKVAAIPYGDKLTSGDFEAYYQKAFRIRRPVLGRMVVIRPAVLTLETGGYTVEELGELDVEE